MDLFKNKCQILTVKCCSYFYRHFITPSNNTDLLFLTGNSGEPLEKKTNQTKPENPQALEKEI